jgi:hypothetical protein
MSRASIGDEAPVETAATTGERSITEGMMKLQSAGWSTTLTGMRLSPASCEIWWFTWRSSVAAIAKWQPSMSSARNCRARCSSSPAARRCSRAGASRGETTVTAAPERSSELTLRTAISPPPTTRQGLFLISRKIGRCSMGLGLQR